MDWAGLYEQITSGSPLAIGAVLIGLAWSTRRAVLATVARFGERLGRVEQARAGDRQEAKQERDRRWQIEAVLIQAGIDLPPWPDLATVVPPPTPRHASLPPVRSYHR